MSRRNENVGHTSDDERPEIDLTQLTRAQEATLRRIRRLEGNPLPPTRGEILRDHMWLALSLGLEITTKSAFFYSAYQNGATMPEGSKGPKDVFALKVAKGQGDYASLQTDVCLTFWLFHRIGEFITRPWEDGIEHIAETWVRRGSGDYMKPLRGFLVRFAMVWCHGLACWHYDRIQKSREQRPREVTWREQERIRLELAAEEDTSDEDEVEAKNEEEEEGEEVKVSGANTSTPEADLRARNQPKGRRRRSHQYRSQLKEELATKKESEQSIPEEAIAGDN
ncbi:hypothetical protein KEM56_007020 [Ascosphaera pollenicola]|nr:hypothetical protein KEM56_007020 [Ascosphaera pollenicola]